MADGHAKDPKYLRLITEYWPYFDKVMDYQPEFASVGVGDTIEIECAAGFPEHKGVSIGGDYRIIKIKNDMMHDYFWVEKVDRPSMPIPAK